MRVWKFYSCLREKLRHGNVAEGRLLIIFFLTFIFSIGLVGTRKMTYFALEPVGGFLHEGERGNSQNV